MYCYEYEGTPPSRANLQRGNVIVSTSQFANGAVPSNENVRRSDRAYSSADPHNNQIITASLDDDPPADDLDIPIPNQGDQWTATSNSKAPLANASYETETLQNGDDRNRSQGEKTQTTKKKTINFVCNICNKGFKHESYYKYHIRTHSGDRPFKCDLCTKSFFERSKLNRHLSSCHSVKNSLYEEDELKTEDDERSKTCPECNKVFSRSSGLQAHLRTHTKSRPFPCTKCGKKFSGLTALKNHEKSHEGTKSVLCQICGKVFLLQKYLNLHLKTTHGKGKRQHKCTRCRKAFHSEKDLKRHHLMHSNEKTFACSLCQTAFKRKDNLNRHLKLTHQLTPDQITQQTSPPLETVAKKSVPTPPPLKQAAYQVSVIKSTHEVMMSMSMTSTTRGHM